MAVETPWQTRGRDERRKDQRGGESRESDSESESERQTGSRSQADAAGFVLVGS